MGSEQQSLYEHYICCSSAHSKAGTEAAANQGNQAAV